MTTLFDIAEAERAADAGIAQVKRKTDPEWIKFALACVRAVCLAMPEFIIDEVWKRTGVAQKPDDCRAMGAVMRAAVKIGLCEGTDRFIPSAQKSCHGNQRRIWRSKLFVER